MTLCPSGQEVGLETHWALHGVGLNPIGCPMGFQRASNFQGLQRSKERSIPQCVLWVGGVEERLPEGSRLPQGPTLGVKSNRLEIKTIKS